MSDLASRVCAHPFLEGLECEALGGLIEAAVGVVEWGPGVVVARTGSPADRCFLVETGDMAVEVHRPGRDPRIIQTVNDGEVLGWSWLVEPYRWTFDVRTLTPTTAIGLDAAKLRTALDEDHELGYMIIKRFAWIMSARLEHTRHQLLDVYGARD